METIKVIRANISGVDWASHYPRDFVCINLLMLRQTYEIGIIIIIFILQKR